MAHPAHATTPQPSPPVSPLRNLPFARWAHRLRGGEGALAGRLEAPLGPFPPGPITASFAFVGGHEPRVHSLVVNGATIEDRHALAALGALLDAVHDLSITGSATPDGDLLVRLALGVEVVIPARTVLRVEGAAIGNPAAPILDRALALSFDGDALRLSHEVRWVARLAEIRLARASLLPDGTVALEARAATKAADLTLRMPLHRAASRLTELVRRSPRIRSFLRRR